MMKPSSLFVLAAAVMFLCAWIATSGEKETPTALSLAYGGLAFANFWFAMV